MKTVFFTEEQFQNINELAKELWEDEQDPSSTDYVRKLHRPKTNWWGIVLYVIASLAVLAGAVFGVWYFSLPKLPAVLLVVAVMAVYLALTVKRVAICAIKLYQRFAPDALRNKCRFEPSCSEYMLLSIRKYGMIKGACKGIDRLKRCNVNDGGFDDP